MCCYPRIFPGLHCHAGSNGGTRQLDTLAAAQRASSHMTETDVFRQNARQSATNSSPGWVTVSPGEGVGYVPALGPGSHQRSCLLFFGIHFRCWNTAPMRPWVLGSSRLIGVAISPGITVFLVV